MDASDDSDHGGAASSGRAAAPFAYWRRVGRLTVALLAVWLLVTLVGPWFADETDGLQVFGFPLSFWVASQGALVLYVVITVVYAVAMDRLDASAAAAASPAEAHGADG